MGEGSDSRQVLSCEQENWRKSLRAKVTALKCHVMASQGLTPQGTVGPAYTPDVLLNDPVNACVIRAHCGDPCELDDYVSTALKEAGLPASSSTLSAGLHPDHVHIEVTASSESIDISAPLNCDKSLKCDQSLPNANSNTLSKSECKSSSLYAVESELCNNNSERRMNMSCHDSKIDSVVRDNDSLINNNHIQSHQNNINKVTTDISQWKWKASFESDNEEEDEESGPVANGYMRISLECDELDGSRSEDISPHKTVPILFRELNDVSGAEVQEQCINTSIMAKNNERCGREECLCCKSLQEVLKQLEKKDLEVNKLSCIRNEVENELQDLTANLFQEAHNMVAAANQKAAASEKSLKESRMAVDVLTSEVAALKSMVMVCSPTSSLHQSQSNTSVLKSSASRSATNSSSGKALNHSKLGPVASSPALYLLGEAALTVGSSSSLPAGSDSASSGSSTVSALRLFQRGHKKSPSDFDLKYGRDTTPPSSPLKAAAATGRAVPASVVQHMQTQPLEPDCWEVDPVCHREFVAWQQQLTTTHGLPESGELDVLSSVERSAFLRRVYEEDIELCLRFPNSTLSHAVERAVRLNDLYIEEVNARHQHAQAPSTHPDVTRKCVLLEVARFCKYRFRLGNKLPYNWFYISQLARNRIIAVCDFLNYLRYIKKGLVKSSIHDMYWEVIKLRRQMSLARLGF